MMVSSRAPSQDAPAIQALRSSPADEYATEAPLKSKTLINLIELDGIKVLGISQEDEEFYKNCTEAFRKKVYQKIDRRLLPMLAMVYLIAHVDRTNIGNARIEGLEKELQLTSMQWSFVLAIFFIPYVLLEIPSNMVIRHCRRPSRYIGPLVTLWGLVMIGHAFIQNLSGLLALRALLGVFQAGFFPGVVYLLTTWYMPQQLAIRIAIFNVMGTVSGAFSGVLAASIARLHGTLGISGWRWIFLLDATTSLTLGILCIFMLIDSPETSQRWLAPAEVRFLQIQGFIKAGGKASRDSREEPLREKMKQSLAELRGVLLHWRLYLQAGVNICVGTCSWAIKVTLPTITKAMGFSNTGAQLMSCPPYAAAGLTVLLFAYLSDRQYRRLAFVLAALCLATAALGVINGTGGDVANHIPLFMSGIILAFMGFSPILPLMASWVAGNLAPAGRRAVGLALVNALAGISGIAGSFLFQGGPETYQRSFAVGLGLMLGATGLASLVGWTYKRANDQRATENEDVIRGAFTEDELLEMGDRSPLWRYKL